MKESIQQFLDESAQLITSIAKTPPLEIEQTSRAIITACQKGGKVLIFGNGGSAADSQHFAAELIGRFKKERQGLPAIALTTDSSILTALSNDYSFDCIFSRQIEALGQKGDVAIGISTSGKAKNVIAALKTARAKGLKTIALTGATGTNLKELTDITLLVASDNTPHIQEAHILVIHIICKIVEEAFSS